MTNELRTPHRYPDLPISVLVQQWSEVRMRVFLTKRTQQGQVDPDDLFAELVYGAQIARQATAGRWCVVADLLRAGAVESWAQVGGALDLTETEARDGFHAWIAGQVSLRDTGDTLGMTAAEAETLYGLSEAVGW
jgi:hypothetical protein